MTNSKGFWGFGVLGFWKPFNSSEQWRSKAFEAFEDS